MTIGDMVLQFKTMIAFLLGFGIAVLFLTCTYLGGLQNLAQQSTNLSELNNAIRSGGSGKSTQIKETQNNLIVVYNRVPKTGSTSFTNIAYDLCGPNKFNVLHLNVSKNSHVLTLSDQFRLANNVTRWKDKHPGFFHGHIAYFDFSAFGAPRTPIFINIIREPIDRLVSYYYFLRYGDDFRPYLSRRRQGDTKSIDECVELQDKDCDPSNMWLQVPFFCGHAVACWEPQGNIWALEQAKRNLVEKYFLVGVTEELESFVDLLEATLPSMFFNAGSLYRKGEKSHLRKTYNKTIPLPSTMEKLKRSDAYKAESDFYRFAYEQFQFAKDRTLISNNGRLVDRGQQYFFEKIRPRNKTRTPNRL